VIGGRADELSSRRAVRVARNAREEIVAGVMGELLGVEEVGVEEHFFEAGGHSLLGLELLKVLSQVSRCERCSTTRPSQA
jgi:Phosphopantetheine attachment site